MNGSGKKTEKASLWLTRALALCCAGALALAGCSPANVVLAPQVPATGEDTPPQETPAVEALPETVSTPTLTPEQQDIQDALETALLERVSKTREQGDGPLAMMVNELYVDHYELSADGSTALVWVGAIDSSTGQPIETEPGLAVASLDALDASKAFSWEMALPYDNGFSDTVAQLPAELKTEDVMNAYTAQTDADAKAAATVYRGYRLPWAAGQAKRVTNSIGHYLSVSGGFASCPSSCQYAFDFADGTMFPLLAAKGGTVKYYKTTCGNGDANCTNYLVLQDQSTTPTTYQVYYHMAYESLPTELRSVGTQVVQGQYLGNADDTGVSTGHHLHFHVHTTANSVWGNSVDIRFDDVSDNDGRPRTQAEAQQYPNLGSDYRSGNLYTSGNVGANPPTGDILSPAWGDTINGSSMTVGGVAYDNLGVTKVQLLANTGSKWIEVGDPQTFASQKSVTFAITLSNLCAYNMDGSFELGLKIYDLEGNVSSGLPGQRTVFANANCPPPPPACQPASNEVALYNEVNFEGGCKKFALTSGSSVTDFNTSALGVVGDNRALSVQVGSGVRAVLYDLASFTVNANGGRSESFEADDYNLSDNRVGGNRVSSLRVQSRSGSTNPAPMGVYFNIPEGLTTVDSPLLSWWGGSGAVEYTASVVQQGAGGVTRSMSKANINTWSPGALPAGTYDWYVIGYNTNGTKINTSMGEFTVTAATLPAATARGLPYAEEWDSGAGDWSASGGWSRGVIEAGGQAVNAWVFAGGSGRQSGALTSPPIQLPGGASFLRFRYFSEVESWYRFYDQRRVQVAVDGQGFTDVLQLTEDVQGQFWQDAPVIDLSAYAGKRIRVRFLFDTVDGDNNSWKGWAIDSARVTTETPAACGDNRSIQTLASAQALSLGASVSGEICPNGEVDYYAFTVAAGQRVGIDIDAYQAGSQLDPYIFLLDSAGNLILENDDEVTYTIPDSRLGIRVRNAGTYYVKIKAWNHPSAGGPAYYYTIKMSDDILFNKTYLPAILR